MKKFSTPEQDGARMAESVIASIPVEPPDIIKWAEEHVQFPSSARSKHFNISVTPWLLEPLTRAVDLKTRVIDLVKPVQSGGSVFGEVIILYWIMFWRGFLQYNWSNDKRADERWASRILPNLMACAPVAEKVARSKVSIGEIDFGNIFFRNQGAFISDNLDSDSVRLQVNEEVHSWEKGHLKKAGGRATAVWDYKQANISNAGTVGDQLDQSYSEGTQQTWEVKCPFCSNRHHKANTTFHILRTKWEDDHPEIGGLRYDAEGCRVGFLEYNYNKLRPTIHYQMPCGGKVHNEDLAMRRSMSSSGRYTEPRNLGAELLHRSYTYEAVIVDYIDWMTIIKDKHSALKARALGDPEPFRRYKQERECIPYDPNDIPLLNTSTVTVGLKKSREGLTVENKLRLGALDRQQGLRTRGELPFWWLALRDFAVIDGKLVSQLVFEGKLENDDSVIAVLDEHKVNRWQVVADSGDDTTHVYQFCIRYGINAIKGGSEDFYVHEGGARRIFSQERPLHSMINRPSMFPYVSVGIGGGREQLMPDPREPLFWIYSKAQIRERLYFLRTETDYRTPDDVSEDYRQAQESEERIEYVSPTDGSRTWKWVQRKRRNDQFVNEAYIAMQVDQAGMLLSDIANKIDVNVTTENATK